MANVPSSSPNAAETPNNHTRGRVCSPDPDANVLDWRATATRKISTSQRYWKSLSRIALGRVQRPADLRSLHKSQAGTQSHGLLGSTTQLAFSRSLQRRELRVWSLATLCVQPQRQQTRRSRETLIMFRLAHPKRHLLFSRHASTKSTNNRAKQITPTTDVQKTSSRIYVVNR
jgi:hypothetical protein